MIEVISFLLVAFALLLPLLYLALMANYMRAWQQLSPWNLPKGYFPVTSIDLIIPARNEAGQLRACLQSIVKTDYPESLLSIYVVDDQSTDQTAAIAQEFSDQFPHINFIQLTEGSPSSKKQALAAGIKAGQGKLIVCTDADCEVPPKWLQYFSSYFEAKQVLFIAAPVNFYQEKTLLERFQSLDFLGMMLITGAGIRQGWMHMSNGANLAYTREAFEKVNGFEGIDHLASGDDILLMQKMVQAFPGRIGFIKNTGARVYTAPQDSWSAFIQQRLRWATKSSVYPEWKITLALSVVFFTCWMILVSLALTIWDIRFLGLFLFQVGIKSGIDYIFLKKASQFFKRGDLMSSFFPAQILHILYISGIGLMANLFKTYEWKGRKVR